MRMVPRCSRAAALSGWLAISALPTVGTASAANAYEERMYDVEPAATLREHRPDEIDMMLDGFFVRPLMLGYTLVSTVGFVITLPFTILGGHVGEAADQLVSGPVRYTFARGLGHMEQVEATTADQRQRDIASVGNDDGYEGAVAFTAPNDAP